MSNVWTWGGNYFGYVEGKNLWTHSGRHAGVIIDDNIYGSDGYYLGEIKSENRLITKISMKRQRKSGFTPYSNKSCTIPIIGYIGHIMYVGHEDFPDPSVFE